jgi:hypothetical protein
MSQPIINCFIEGKVTFKSLKDSMDGDRITALAVALIDHSKACLGHPSLHKFSRFLAILACSPQTTRDDFIDPESQFNLIADDFAFITRIICSGNFKYINILNDQSKKILLENYKRTSHNSTLDHAASNNHFVLNTCYHLLSAEEIALFEMAAANLARRAYTTALVAIDAREAAVRKLTVSWVPKHLLTDREKEIRALQLWIQELDAHTRELQKWELL